MDLAIGNEKRIKPRKKKKERNLEKPEKELINRLGIVKFPQFKEVVRLE